MADCFIARTLSDRLPKPDERRLVVLTGARQMGKTTLAQSLYGGLRYVNLDALEYRDQLRSVSSFGWGAAVKGNSANDNEGCWIIAGVETAPRWLGWDGPSVGRPRRGV